MPAPALAPIIESNIFLIRDKKVMLDENLATLYKVETKRLNEAVSRNKKRFPKDFMFRLSARETVALRSQIATSNVGRGGRRHRPYAFTELGVSMLSSVLNSDRAIEVNIAIMRTFTRLREMLATHRELDLELDHMRAQQKQHTHQIQAIFEAIQRIIDCPVEIDPKRRIGFPTSSSRNSF